MHRELIMTSLDIKNAEKFSERILAMLNDSALVLMMSLGDRLGLFDVFASLPNATSDEIAKKASLNERYVREWLAALVAGKIAEYDPVEKTYRLPLEYAASLCDSVSDEHFNFAGIAQFVPMLGLVEDQITSCFKNGGGVPYSEYPRFQEGMANYSDMLHRATLVDATLPAAGIIDLLEQGIDVLDVGCGRGFVVQLMAQAFPDSHFTGVDFSEEAISFANQRCQEDGIGNTRFLAKDAANMDESGAYDFVTTFDAIHDQAWPGKVLDAIYKALKPGGRYLMAEPKASSNLEDNIGGVFSPFNYATSLMHCMTVSLAYGGEGLGQMWGKQKAVEYLQKAGFQEIDVKEMEHDFDNYYFLAVKQ
jgi:ubiquinone/menaquinone biosynthesis C-methylase UbiE